MPTISRYPILADVHQLESLPHVVYKVLALLNDAKSTTQQVADMLALDPGLAARVLTLAGGSLTARRAPTLREALVRLGFSTVRSLVITAALIPLLDRPLPGYALAHGQFWRHSVACGLCARLVARMTNAADSEEAYLAGLLHDVGKLIIDRHLAAELAQVLTLVEQQRLPFVDAERLVLGFDHAQIGEIITEQWRLPVLLIEAVARHHQPLTTPGPSLLPHIIHVADAITHLQGIGVGSQGYATADYAVVCHLGLDADHLQALTDQLPAVLAATLDDLGLDGA